MLKSMLSAWLVCNCTVHRFDQMPPTPAIRSSERGRKRAVSDLYFTNSSLFFLSQVQVEEGRERGCESLIVHGVCEAVSGVSMR